MGAGVPSVYIVNGDRDYSNMFLLEGWVVTDRLSEADLVQFTGGADVSPYMYGEPAHPSTYVHAARDAYESAVFQACLNQSMPMAGICRGGQFLNVMCGGLMWQDVDQHAIHGFHAAFDHVTKSVVPVSSTHHQMMRPNSKAEVLMTARIAHRKERMGQSGGTITSYNDDADIEALFYDEQRSLCYQPHPEMGVPGIGPCRLAYFNYLEHCFGLKALPLAAGGR
jgi:gamma-glutamyl-gamma-aminobutyrate hydrolase PuuD